MCRKLDLLCLVTHEGKLSCQKGRTQGARGSTGVVRCPARPRHVQGQELDLQHRLNTSVLEPVIPLPRRIRRGPSSLSSPPPF